MAIMRPILGKISRVDEASLEAATSLDDARTLMAATKALFRLHMAAHGVDPRIVTQMMTKFHDAGRRSPPWQPGSSKGIYRRPQDGPDGNRQRRWLFATDHKFYATEVVGTLVEVKYYFQTLSMEGAPPLPNEDLRDVAAVLLGHPLAPGAFLDPLLREPIRFGDFVDDRRSVESGHIVPLGRAVNGSRGRHDVANSTLMLRDSNRIQADKTIPELLNMFRRILDRHQAAPLPVREAPGTGN